MEKSDDNKVPFLYLLPVIIPFMFALGVMLFFKQGFEHPKVPASECAHTESGDKLASREIEGTLQFTSGMFIIKDAQNHITALTRCGKVACSGPYHELKGRVLKEPIRVSFCGKSLISIVFNDGSPILSPDSLEPR